MFLFLPSYLVLSIQLTSSNNPLLLNVGRTSSLLSIQYGKADGISLPWLHYKAKVKGICPCRLRFWFLERERDNGSGRNLGNGVYRNGFPSPSLAKGTREGGSFLRILPPLSHQLPVGFPEETPPQGYRLAKTQRLPLSHESIVSLQRLATTSSLTFLPVCPVSPVPDKQMLRCPCSLQMPVSLRIWGYLLALWP